MHVELFKLDSKCLSNYVRIVIMKEFIDNLFIEESLREREI